MDDNRGRRGRVKNREGRERGGERMVDKREEEEGGGGDEGRVGG